MSTRILVLVGILALSGGCTASPKRDTASATATSDAAVRLEVQSALKAYVEAANRADISTMMGMVSRRDGVTSVAGGDVDRGWDAIRRSNDELVGKEGNYKMALGSVDVLVLSPTIAVAVSPFAFTAAGENNVVRVPGVLSAVFEKTNGKWLVVHEHTSAKTEDAETEGD